MSARDPFVDPRKGDKIKIQGGLEGEVFHRTPFFVFVLWYANGKLLREQRYGVPNAWTSEITVDAEVLHVAE